MRDSANESHRRTSSKCSLSREEEKPQKARSLRPSHGKIFFFKSVKVKSAYEPSGPSGRSLSQFRSIERLRVFLLPPGWDASPSQGYPQHVGQGYSFTHLGGERHSESTVSCPRTQHNVPCQGSNQDCST